MALYPNHLKHGLLTRRRPEFEPNEVVAEVAKLKKFSDAGGLKYRSCPTPSKTHASGGLGLSSTLSVRKKKLLPRPFVLRRVHSLLGVWLTLFLVEHLWINAQMLLLPLDHGSHFVALVNKIHHMPYLPLIEISMLGLPFLIHGGWGMLYLFTGKSNAHRTEGASPALPEYPRNRAYTWQRRTAWLLLIGLVAHVVEMRFVDYPTKRTENGQSYYLIRLKEDRGLSPLAEQLGIALYQDNSLPVTPPNKPLQEGEWWGIAPHAGEAFVLIVRQTFQNMGIVLLYSLFVLAAVYHACNGIWTATITWGLCVTKRSQQIMRRVTSSCMVGLLILGWGATWGTYLMTVWL